MTTKLDIATPAPAVTLAQVEQKLRDLTRAVAALFRSLRLASTYVDLRRLTSTLFPLQPFSPLALQPFHGAPATASAQSI